MADAVVIGCRSERTLGSMQKFLRRDPASNTRKPEPMQMSSRRRLVLKAGITAGMSCALPAANACEFFSVNMRITHPWTRASAVGASTAVICMKFDEVRVADRLVGVDCPVAESAEMSGAQTGDVDLWIPEGRETHLAEEGTCLRLVGLRQPLEVARSYPLRLKFEKGGSVNAVLTIDYERFL